MNDTKFAIREMVDVGDIVIKDGKKYVVIDLQFDIGIMSMRLLMIRYKPERIFRFAKIYEVCDENIEELILVAE